MVGKIYATGWTGSTGNRWWSTKWLFSFNQDFIKRLRSKGPITRRLLNGPAFKESLLNFFISMFLRSFRYCGFFFLFLFFSYLNIETTFMLILFVLHVLTNNTANASEISIVNKACYSKLAFYHACFIISCYLAFCNGIIQGSPITCPL